MTLKIFISERCDVIAGLNVALTHVGVGLGGLLLRGRGALLRLGGAGREEGRQGCLHPGHGHRAVDAAPAGVAHAGVDVGAFLNKAAFSKKTYTDY